MANQLWRGKFPIITQLANYLPKLNGASVLHNPIVHVNDFTKQMPGVPQNISTTHFYLLASSYLVNVMNVQIDFLVDYDKGYNSFSLGISFFHQFNSIFYLLSGL